MEKVTIVRAFRGNPEEDTEKTLYLLGTNGNHYGFAEMWEKLDAFSEDEDIGVYTPVSPQLVERLVGEEIPLPWEQD